jgi:hypothetical protein
MMLRKYRHLQVQLLKPAYFHLLIQLFLMFVSIEFTLGQACGTYRIRYVGMIDLNDNTILEVKVPSIPLLHGYEKPNSSRAFIVAETDGNSINFETVSHLTSELYNDPSDYLKIYNKIRDTLPIKFRINTDNKPKELTVEIPWDKIVITAIDDDTFGNLFQIDLGKIRVLN